MAIKIDIFSKNIELNPALREFIEEKLGSLDRYIPGLADIRVEIARPSKHHRSGHVFYAEANVKLGGKVLRAQAHHLDLHSAIIDVRDELKELIKKFKEKRADSARKPRK
ncbi:MAG: ribosomal subunit interface protein [Candidatus Yanofskybacteria bacterium RIFCSPLOWO2_01_FULL_49_17]|uniref:Ribosomal subunit interface protein n=1 Tax=Candidatus Yanofskybacteria bacterium RIFCSPLOWO2_01_FULL_49_17 TaxID=1802700 RepID=A0A1F8GQJ9_9BACT|nr:MAG: ribosomal subunit interface protein [Candidatus Yanofskybacteria bacterium RIFCSPLOWO2_01_FULL_49_17]